MASSPPLPRFRFLFRPKWIAFHAVVLAAVVSMVNLGVWQLDRLDERRVDNAAFVAQIEQPPVPLDEITSSIRSGVEPEAFVNRRITASGVYRDDQVVLFNRSQGGRAVDNVLTALELGDDDVLVVNRGAIGVEVTPPTPFPGEVEIVGRLRLSETRARGELSDAQQEVVTQVRRVDLDQLAGQFASDGELVPMYVELLASDPPVGPDDPQLLDPPELSEGNHLSYAFQWFIFAFCVAVGWVLAVRRSLTTAEANARTPSGPPPSTDAESTTAPA